MSIVGACRPRSRHEASVLIEVSVPLGADETARILGILLGIDSATPVVIDVRSVSHFEDHLLVQIAEALASRKGGGSFIGLPLHHVRILKYVGLEPQSQ